MSVVQVIEVATIDSNDRNNEATTVKITNRKQRWLRAYFSKWTGQHLTAPLPPVTLFDCIITFFGTLLGVSVLSIIHYRLIVSHHMEFFAASFGASAVLLYGLPLSPLSQPRNVIGGQVISAIVGCSFRIIFSTVNETYAPVTLSVCVTVLLMQITNTMHAPAGATAVLAITTTPPLPWAGFQFVLMPVLSSSIILVFFAVVVNNLVSSRHYPCRWW